ncbi:MAG TPA: hypothetical protein VFO10_02845 [Oligoflexus sp.]|uniref:hypothetical protein n=1 Tax=Oligoflexus sp. TaxID=1971216 RepID=UPI002D803EED|nr:hypothetical protein [Oligoflexus sp.]HET9236160.1 hypothetical protein [Oligoflexus sp.]
MDEDGIKAEFEEELRTESHILVRLKTKYIRYRAIADELDQYRDENGLVEIAYPELFEDTKAAYEKMIIDLASYCTGWAPAKPDHKGMRPKGFLEKAHESRDLFKMKSLEDVNDATILMVNKNMSLKALQEAERHIQDGRKHAVIRSLRNSFAALFSGWDELAGVSEENTVALQKVFRDEVKLLKTIRNDHLAHRYENENLERRATTPRAEFRIVDGTFEKIEAILGYFWFIVFDGSYRFPKYRRSEPGCRIRDLVDLMRFGTVHRVLEGTGVAEILAEKDPDKPFYEHYRREYGRRVREMMEQKRNRGKGGASQIADERGSEGIEISWGEMEHGIRWSLPQLGERQEKQKEQ